MLSHALMLTVEMLKSPSSTSKDGQRQGKTGRSGDTLLSSAVLH